MSSTKYRAFIKVAELGSFTAAANALGYSQPGIHHMISILEKELGFPLFIRSKNQITCTEEGKKALYYCYQIVKNEDYLHETASSIHGLLSGSVRVGACNSLLTQFIPEVVHSFSRVYSNITLYIHEYPYGQFNDVLTKQIIDLAFMNEHVPEDFEFIPLFHDSAVVIMAEDHPFSSYEKISTKHLSGCSFIMPSSGYDDLITAVNETQSFQPSTIHYVSSDTAVYSMVRLNIGISIISNLQIGSLPQGITVRPLEIPAGRQLGIAVRDVKRATPAVKEFIHVAKKQAVSFQETLQAP